MASSTLQPTDANAWQRFVADFDRTRGMFADQFSRLQRLSQYAPQLSPELRERYNRLLAQGARHQATLAQLQNVRNQVTNWLADMGRGAGAIGAAVSSAASGAWDALRNTFGLSAVPVIVGVAGVAGAAGAVALIARWIMDAQAVERDINAQYRLIESGATPQEAARIVQQTRQTASQGLIPSLLGVDMKWILIAGVLIFLGPPLIKMIGERR